MHNVRGSLGAQVIGDLAGRGRLTGLRPPVLVPSAGRRSLYGLAVRIGVWVDAFPGFRILHRGEILAYHLGLDRVSDHGLLAAILDEDISVLPSPGTLLLVELRQV